MCPLPYALEDTVRAGVKWPRSLRSGAGEGLPVICLGLSGLAAGCILERMHLLKAPFFLLLQTFWSILLLTGTFR